MSYRMLSERSGVSKSKLQAVFTGERPMLVPDMESVAEALGLVPWQVMKRASERVLSAAPDSIPDAALLIMPGQDNADGREFRRVHEEKARKRKRQT